MKPLSARVLVLLDGDAELPLLLPLVEVFEDFELPFELVLASANRDPERLAELARGAEARGIGVIVAAAAMAGHLAGAAAAQSTLPVIGVPLSSSALQGVDALYSTVQMPRGIPVASVGVDRADNAAYLCIAILALSDASLAERLQAARSGMREALRDRDRRLQQLGPQGYLEAMR